MLEEQDIFLASSFWHLVGHSSQLPNHYSYFTFKLHRFELVAYNYHGSVIVFENKCPHRGAKFFLESSGSSPIVCPYHGWTFTKDSVSIPLYHTFKASPGNPRDARLNQWSVELVSGFIFIAYTPLRSLDCQLGSSVYDLVASIGSSVSHLYSLNLQEFSSNWRIAVENSLEAYHVKLIHRDSLAKLSLDYGTNHLYDHASILNHVVSDRRANNLFHLASKFLANPRIVSGYCSIYLFPFCSLSTTCGISFSLQNYFPRPDPSSPDGCIFRSSLYAPKIESGSTSAHPLIDSMLSSSDRLNRQVFFEDASVCSSIPLSAWSLNEPYYLSSLEEKVSHFRSILRRLFVPFD